MRFDPSGHGGPLVLVQRKEFSSKLENKVTHAEEVDVAVKVSALSLLWLYRRRGELGGGKEAWGH